MIHARRALAAGALGLLLGCGDRVIQPPPNQRLAGVLHLLDGGQRPQALDALAALYADLQRAAASDSGSAPPAAKPVLEAAPLRGVLERLIALDPEQVDPELAVQTALSLSGAAGLAAAREPLAARAGETSEAGAYLALYAWGHLLRFSGLDGEELFRRAAAARPDRAEARFALGVCLSERRRSADALAEFDLALAADPTHAGARYGRAVELERLGQEEPALTELRAVAASGSPHAVQAANDIGRLLAARGDLDGALAAFQVAVEADPERASARYNLGGLLFHRGDGPAAAVHLEAAARLRPADARPRVLLGRIAEERGDAGAAERWYREALALADAAPEAAQRLAALLEGQGRLADLAELRQRNASSEGAAR